jgi:hypothetical protein
MIETHHQCPGTCHWDIMNIAAVISRYSILLEILNCHVTYPERRGFPAYQDRQELKPDQLASEITFSSPGHSLWASVKSAVNMCTGQVDNQEEFSGSLRLLSSDTRDAKECMGWSRLSNRNIAPQKENTRNVLAEAFLVFISAFCSCNIYNENVRPPTIPKWLLDAVQHPFLLVETCQEIMQVYGFSPSLLPYSQNPATGPCMTHLNKVHDLTLVNLKIQINVIF